MARKLCHDLSRMYFCFLQAMGEAETAKEQMAAATTLLQQLHERCEGEGRLAGRWEQLQLVLSQLMETSSSSSSTSHA